jgi:hypothetical protein
MSPKAGARNLGKKGEGSYTYGFSSLGASFFSARDNASAAAASTAANCSIM